MNNFFKFNLNNISRLTYRKDINGLRAIAVLAVVLFHAEIDLFNGGYLGVDVFFVISGYLISNIIVSELNNRQLSFKNFYIKRARRILPALLSTIVICIPFTYWLLTPKATIEFLKSSIASLFLYSNFYFQNLDFYNAEPTKLMPLLHTWSLSIEEQFYLIFPLLSYLIYKYQNKFFTFYLTTLFIFSLYLNSTTYELSKFYQISFRAWELLLGVLLMIITNKYTFKYLNYIGSFVLLFSFMYFKNDMLSLNSIEPKLIAALGTSLIIVSNQNKSNFLLENSFLQFVGNISYSLYLFHQPFFAFYKIYAQRYDINLKNELPILVLILLCFSYLNWRFIELQFKKSSIQILFSFLFFLIFLILSFSYFGLKSGGYKERFDYISEDVLFYSSQPVIFPTSIDLDEFNSYCPSNKKENLYIVGDSHAYTFSYSLIKNFKDLSCNYSLKIFSGDAGRCLLSQQSDIVGYVGWCTQEAFEDFLNEIENNKPTIITIGRFDTWLDPNKASIEVKCNECNFREVFSARLKAISKNAKNIIILEPVPTHKFNISEQYLFKKIKLSQNITRNYQDWLNYINPTKEFINNLELQNTTLVETSKVLCDIVNNICFGSKDKILYYSDTNHLTIAGNDLIINFILSLID